VITVPMVEIKRRASWSMFSLGEKRVLIVMLLYIDILGHDGLNSLQKKSI
jgi:hypothetical protein